MALDLRSLAYNYTEIKLCAICIWNDRLYAPVRFLICLQYALLIKTSRYLCAGACTIIICHNITYWVLACYTLIAGRWMVQGGLSARFDHERAFAGPMAENWAVGSPEVLRLRISLRRLAVGETWPEHLLGSLQAPQRWTQHMHHGWRQAGNWYKSK